MLYLGGKGRVGAEIAKAILEHTKNRDDYYELCIGGGSSFERIAPHFQNLHASDTHEDLMLMWSAVATGWSPPSEVSEDFYRQVKSEIPSALRGFVGFGCSFGGKWWGGYARSKQNGDDYYARHAAKSLERMRPLLARTELRHASFDTWSPERGAVVYADPPYRGTTNYKGKFDHDRFWLTMRAWVERGVDVFVSEYAAPDGWRSIWQKDQRRKVSGGTGDMTTECLFVFDPANVKESA